jgi:putative SOS response-associated peptidase YedK
MCSQFESVIPIAKLAKYTNSIYDEQTENLLWDTHVYPHAKAPVIIRPADTNSITLMNYSLIPSWSKTAKPKFATYNARLDRQNKDASALDLIYNLPTWRKPFKQQRCIVPLTGFYESCHTGTHAGYIVKFTPVNPEDILLAAGIWDTWLDGSTGEIIVSFAILTDDPNTFILNIGHDRQPVFLSQENANAWLHCEKLKTEEAYTFLKSNQDPVNYSVTNYRPLKKHVHNDLFS